MTASARPRKMALIVYGQFMRAVIPGRREAADSEFRAARLDVSCSARLWNPGSLTEFIIGLAFGRTCWLAYPGATVPRSRARMRRLVGFEQPLGIDGGIDLRG
jgi:hypothetical protein